MKNNKKIKNIENICKYKNHSISLFNEIDYLSNKKKLEFKDKFSEPRNEYQIKFFNHLNNLNYKIVAVSGSTNTGKTLFSIERGIYHHIIGSFDKLIFTKPNYEKSDFWIKQIYEILHKFMSIKEITELIEKKIIEITPIHMITENTCKNSWIIADEMQESTILEMKILLNKLCENSRIIILGNLEKQYKNIEMNGLDDLLNKIKGKRSDSLSSVDYDKIEVGRDSIKETMEIYETNRIPIQYID